MAAPAYAHTTMRQRHLLLAVLLLLAACGAPPAPAAPPSGSTGALIAAESALIDTGAGRPAEGDPAPDFRYTLPDGSSVKLSDLRGTPVILNFWATWCVPCVEEMPHFQQALDDAGGDLLVLAVNRNELPEAIARFAPKVDVRYPLIADLSGAIGDRYGVTSLPITFFIRRDGTIAARQFGAISPELLAQRVDELK